MTSLLLDLRYAARILRKQGAFTAAAVATLAVAIAANTAIFSLIHSVLLRPLQLPRPDRVVRIEEIHNRGRFNVTGATTVDLMDRARSFSATAAFRVGSPGFSTGSAPEQVVSAQVSSEYFEVLGVGPSAGRVFREEDFAAGAAPTVVISDGLWRRALGADPSVIGRRVLVNAVPTEIIAVMPSAFFAPGTPAIWLPRPPNDALPRNRRAHLFYVIARLSDDATLPSARADLEALSETVLHDSAHVDPDMRLVATGLQARLVEDIRPGLLLLWVAVGVLLLIGASNIANLLLMQGAVRTRELSVRAALGASRGRLVTQLVIESLLLALAGGGLGTAFGLWSVRALAGVLPASLTRVPLAPPDWRIAVFGLCLSVLTAMFFGLVSALRVSRQQPAGALRDRSAGIPSSAPIRATLVATEVALTVVLLAAAGLLGRSFLSVVRVDVGFDPTHAIAFDLSLPSSRYPTAAAHATFHERIIEGLAQIPGVTAVAAAGAIPMAGTAATTMEPEGGTLDQVVADVINATPGYFAALRIPLRRGRLYTSADRGGAAPVMLINEAAAATFWPSGAAPVGRFVTMKDWGSPYRAQVIGVVGNVRQGGPESAMRPAVYYPLAQFPETTLRESIVIRTAGPVPHVLTAAREQVWRIDRDQAVAAVRSMEDVVRMSTADRRFNLVLIAAFATAALLLAGVGVYGVVAFAVGQRTREIGVRVALGARPGDVIRLTFAQAALPVGVGLAAGLAGPLMASRAFDRLLVGVEPTDAPTLAAVTCAVCALAAAACIGPTRRALGVDPATALRGE